MAVTPKPKRRNPPDASRKEVALLRQRVATLEAVVTMMHKHLFHTPIASPTKRKRV